MGCGLIQNHMKPMTFWLSWAALCASDILWAQALNIPLGTNPSALEATATLDTVSVTATREKTTLQATPASVGVIDAPAIRFNGLTHPQQILSQIPGVAVGVTNGEGHNMAIRQPFSTSPLYLYLEDGLPIRATGFFNHNALYEVNLPQAGGIEVVRGPGSALYGSDAFAGTVNVLTRAPDRRDGVQTALEVGSFGWTRWLIDATVGANPNGGLRISVNRSQSEGWRQHTGYERTSANLRWDHAVDEQWFVKTLLGFTTIDQQTGANSPLIRADYLNQPTKNNFAPAYRQVQALRWSSELSHEKGPDAITFTPYVRANQMDLNGSYNFSSDPRIEKSQVTSLGLLSKWRHEVGGPYQVRIITGIDWEQSPGSRTEDALTLSKTGSGADTSYNGYTVGPRIYNYAVQFKSQSAYGHLQFSPSPADEVTLGLRHDHLSFGLDNHLLSNVQVGSQYYGQSPDTSVVYSRLSPKWGYTRRLAPQASLYASHNHGFRVPSESQLFRGGSDSTQASASTKALLALSLKPIRVRQTEVGLRAHHNGWDVDMVVYRLEKYDDLLAQRDLASNVSTTVNAGKTLHQGVEWGLGAALNSRWRVDGALSLAQHKYVDWQVSGSSNANYSGKAMEAAPKVMANTRLTWQPDGRHTAQLEWVVLGSYWLEASNSPTYGKYEGHQVFNLRYSHHWSESVQLMARVMNLTDRRYADSASVSSSTPVFTPALPRAFYAGVQVQW